MTLWQDILKSAIIGTERDALSLPVRNDTLGNLLINFDVKEREAYLLNAAATVKLYERAGQLPAKELKSLPIICEAEALLPCSQNSKHHLSLMSENYEYSAFQNEWFTALFTAGKRVPEELIPDLLNRGKADPYLQKSIVNAIGKRGHWLAKQNPDWDYVTSELAESDWEIGTQKSRLALLEKLRSTDPARAREIVASTWDQETPEDREAFISTFKIGLSIADESFLEAALDDRRKDVRKKAADLLAHLPEPAFVQRMIDRVKPLFAFNHKMLGKNKIEVTLPDACDKAMKRDGIEPKPLYSNVGEKTWWVQQMLSLIPPATWIAESGWTINQLIQAALNSEWKKILIESWTSANRLSRDINWAEALYAAQIEEDGALLMLRIFPPERQEELIAQFLQQDPSLLSNFQKNKKYVMAYWANWSATFTKQFIESICFHAQTDAFKTEFWWKRYLINTSIHFDFETIPEVITRLTQMNLSLPESLDVLDSLINALAFRYEAIKEITK